jgi:hypothetical protein
MPARRAKPPLDTHGGFLSNRWSKIGVALVVLGWSPLALIVALASVGLWPNPNPNPIGPGLLFFVTFWPALICLGIGRYQTRRR